MLVNGYFMNHASPVDKKASARFQGERSSAECSGRESSWENRFLGISFWLSCYWLCKLRCFLCQFRFPRRQILQKKNSKIRWLGIFAMTVARTCPEPLYHFRTWQIENQFSSKKNKKRESSPSNLWW